MDRAEFNYGLGDRPGDTYGESSTPQGAPWRHRLAKLGLNVLQYIGQGSSGFIDIPAHETSNIATDWDAALAALKDGNYPPPTK